MFHGAVAPNVHHLVVIVQNSRERGWVSQQTNATRQRVDNCTYRAQTYSPSRTVCHVMRNQMVSGQMFSKQRFFAEGNVATDLDSCDHAERLLLQSDFVPSAEPSTHSGRRIAFAVSPHHFAPLFIGRERYGSGNSTLNYSTDVRNVGRAPDGGGRSL